MSSSPASTHWRTFFSAATAVLRALVVTALADVVAFLEAFFVVVVVRLAAVRVRLTEPLTSVSASLVSSATESSQRLMAAMAKQVEADGESPWTSGETIAPWQEGTAVERGEAGD